MSRLNYLVRDPISFVASRDARRQTLFVGASSPCFIASQTYQDPGTSRKRVMVSDTQHTNCRCTMF